jgi:hypothetical protein
MQKHGISLRELYRTLDVPGASPLKAAHDALDKAVRDAYGMAKSDDPLAFFLALNQQVVSNEDTQQPVVGPGLPPIVKNKKSFVTSDRLAMPPSTASIAKANSN